jgi:hypothetical protein
MGIRKLYSGLAVIALIVIASVFFLFYHFGHNDNEALSGFSIAYQNYDKAISYFSRFVFDSNPESSSAIDNLELRANESFAELKSKSTARISSLTRNDAEIMNIFLEIVNLSEKELDALKAHRRAVVEKLTDSDQLAKEVVDLTIKRQSAYARFLEISK